MVKSESENRNAESRNLVSITNVSKLFDITTRTLRHWEDVGLISPARNSTNTSQIRYYDAYDVARISSIIALRASGVDLLTVKRLMHAEEISDDVLAELENRLSNLSQAANIISALVPQYSNSYPIEEYTLYEQYTVVKSKWVDSIFQAYKFYHEALVECLNDGYEITTNYSIFCQYPLNIRNNDGDLKFIRENFLIRFFLPVTKNFTSSMPQDRFIKNDDFLARPIEKFNGTQTDYVIMPACHGISTVHFGAAHETDEAYVKLYDYMDTNGYTERGLIHEIYLNKPKTGSMQDKMITRIVLPVVPKG